MERDGVTKKQITFEPMGVLEFSVSTADGSLAYVSGNKLYLCDSSGQNRRVIADGALVKAEGEEAFFKNSVSSPSFSPNGQILAYGLDGLHLYDLQTGYDDHVLSNLGNLLNEPFVFSKEIYTPGLWSPDGSKLIITMGYYEGSTLAVMTPGVEQPYTRLRSNGAVCCYVNWSEDSNYVLVANPSFTIVPPGLWRFDSKSGVEEYLIKGFETTGMLNFVGWPYLTSNNDLYFFISRMERFDPEKGIPLRLVHSDADGSNQVVLFDQEYHVRDALWAPGGGLVVVSSRQDDMTNQLILLNTETKEKLILLEDGDRVWGLTWGP
jgi:WD40 repeat protein